jgi:group I intron endonuclease
MTKVSGIYRIVHRDSGRCYIGQSADIGRRWAEHRSLLKLKKHKSKRFQNLWDKYGREAFDWEVLEEIPPDVLTDREQYWMDLLRPVLNHAPAAGSTLGMPRPDASALRKGVPRSAETRAKISAAVVGVPKPWLQGNQYGKANAGRKQTAQQIAKLSAARIGNTNCVGRVLSDETKAKIGAAWTPERRAAHGDKLRATRARNAAGPNSERGM